MNDLDEPRYLISRIARATNVPVTTMRSWLQRGHLWLAEHDRPAEAFGLAHYLSLRSALRIGAMAELIALGVQPRQAGQAALRWTEFGSAERLPAHLHAEPMTVLCVYAGGDAEVKHLPMKGGQAATLFFYQGQRRNSVTAVILDFVDRDVRLGLEAAA